MVFRNPSVRRVSHLASIHLDAESNSETEPERATYYMKILKLFKSADEPKFIVTCSIYDVIELHWIRGALGVFADGINHCDPTEAKKYMFSNLEFNTFSIGLNALDTMSIIFEQNFFKKLEYRPEKVETNENVYKQIIFLNFGKDSGNMLFHIPEIEQLMKLLKYFENKFKTERIFLPEQSTKQYNKLKREMLESAQ